MKHYKPLLNEYTKSKMIPLSSTGISEKERKHLSILIKTIMGFHGNAANIENINIPKNILYKIKFPLVSNKSWLDFERLLVNQHEDLVLVPHKGLRFLVIRKEDRNAYDYRKYKVIYQEIPGGYLIV